jgi:hypothetical protein
VSSNNPIIPTSTAKIMNSRETAEVESALLAEHSVPIIGDKAIWAVVSDFNLAETCRTFMIVVAAFRKLGKHQLAEDLLARARTENFEFVGDHLNKKVEDL